MIAKPFVLYLIWVCVYLLAAKNFGLIGKSDLFGCLNPRVEGVLAVYKSNYVLSVIRSVYLWQFSQLLEWKIFINNRWFKKKLNCQNDGACTKLKNYIPLWIK